MVCESLIKAAIIGGTGYTGSELSRLLSVHPNVDLVALTSRQNEGKLVSEVHPFLKGYTDVRFTASLDKVSDMDVVFVATPHGVAMESVPGLLETGVKVIDLSGDYRLKDIALYEKWYGHVHRDPENLLDAVYGLPELFRSDIKGANLVANPGCYATSAILAIAPLMKSGSIEDDVIIDSKSGTSGAGMVPSPRLHHPFCGEAIIPYSIGTHRHTPEIEMAVGMFSQKRPNVVFSPHLVPVIRGIVSTCYMKLKGGPVDVGKVYEEQYGNETFVSLVDEPSMRSVVGSNHAEVGFKIVGDTVVSFGVLDNLVKGASGQAVQCMNLMFNMDEASGLNFPGLGV